MKTRHNNKFRVSFRFGGKINQNNIEEAHCTPSHEPMNYRRYFFGWLTVESSQGGYHSGFRYRTFGAKNSKPKRKKDKHARRQARMLKRGGALDCWA